MIEVAPNAPGALPYLLYQTVGLSVFAILLVPTLLYRTVCHYVPGQRPHPTWSLRRDLALAAGRLYLSWSERFSLPRSEGKKAWKRSPLIERVVGRGTTTTVVKIPLASEEWIHGIASAGQGIVKLENVPGFWTFEQGGGWKEGSERAAPGEKVIMYIAGGCVLLRLSSAIYVQPPRDRSWVMGHPMGTPFPYRFCTAAHQRVLCA